MSVLVGDLEHKVVEPVQSLYSVEINTLFTISMLPNKYQHQETLSTLFLGDSLGADRGLGYEKWR